MGQSLGAGRKDLAKAHIQISRKISYVTSVVLIVIILLLRRQLAQLFTSDETIIFGASVGYIAVVCGMFSQNGRVVYSGCLRGAGDVKFVAWCSLLSATIVRPIATWLLCYPLDPVLPFLYLPFTGPWISFVIDAIMREVMLMVRVKSEKWATIKL